MKFHIDDYKGKYVMHCKTKEEAEVFYTYLNSIGCTRANRDSYEDDGLDKIYDVYDTETCFNFNNGHYSSKNYYKKQGYHILEMEDFMSDTMYNNDRINKVFEILGLKPNERFSISGDNLSYYIDYELNIHCRTFSDEYKLNSNRSNDMIVDILREKKTIIFAPTKEEQIAIDYARALGCKWIAKDYEGWISGFTEKPHKSIKIWNTKNGKIYPINIPISFIHWEDEEPYYIGD